MHDINQVKLLHCVGDGFKFKNKSKRKKLYFVFAARKKVNRQSIDWESNNGSLFIQTYYIHFMLDFFRQ